MPSDIRSFFGGAPPRTSESVTKDGAVRETHYISFAAAINLSLLSAVLKGVLVE